MLIDKRIPLISATGSTAMGKRVAEVAGKRLARTLLELGGNNGVIVMATPISRWSPAPFCLEPSGLPASGAPASVGYSSITPYRKALTDKAGIGVQAGAYRIAP